MHTLCASHYSVPVCNMLPVKGTSHGAMRHTHTCGCLPVPYRINQPLRAASCIRPQGNLAQAPAPAISRKQRTSVRVQAVVAAPETHLEKGGPGATYGNGAVAKVSSRRSHSMGSCYSSCAWHIATAFGTRKSCGIALMAPSCMLMAYTGNAAAGGSYTLCSSSQQLVHSMQSSARSRTTDIAEPSQTAAANMVAQAAKLYLNVSRKSTGACCLCPCTTM